MKKHLTLFAMLLMLTHLAAIRNWNIYTNTTHIYDMMEYDQKIYQATWGGLQVYDIATETFTRSYSTLDGLDDLDIRAISVLPHSQTILLGTATSGVNRLKNDLFGIPINQIIGLPDDKVNFVVSSDSLIYVATEQGLTTFKDVPDFPYPLPLNHYSTHNGLASNQITALVLTDDNYLLIGTNNGFNYVHTAQMNDAANWRHFHANNSPLPDNLITSLSENNNTIAIATRHGFLRIRNINDESTWALFNNQINPQYVVDDSILTVFVDSDENLWFSYGLWDDTVLYINHSLPEAITRLTPDNEFTVWNEYYGDNDNEDTGLRTSFIKGFREINGVIYAYTWGDGLYYLEDDYWINRKPNTIVTNYITDMVVDRDGKLWLCNGFVGSYVNRKGTRGVSGFDGETWTNFQAKTSPLATDKIFRVTADARNRKWFGGWGGAISVYDEDKDQWYHYNRQNGLAQTTIGALTTGFNGNIWISNYSGGMFILELDAIESTEPTIPVLQTFELRSPNVDYSDVIDILVTPENAFFGSFYSGVRFWDSTDLPQTHQTGDSWRIPPSTNISNGYINKMDYRETHWGYEIWIAAENGLFMYDTHSEDWYRYGTSIKREKWSGSQWVNHELYFIDEERLYGAVPTFPTAIHIDHLDRIWIGTEANGITIFNTNTNRYSILNQDNSPLLSNHITSLVHDPYSGNLYIGTTEGLVSVEIGKTIKTDDIPLKTTIAYPNPFRPDNGEVITIANQDNTVFPKGKNVCHIYSLSGDLITTLEEDTFFMFSWDGRNKEGKQSSSGIYFYVVSSEGGQTSRGTIALIR